MILPTLLASFAFADEESAEICMRNRVMDGYTAGYAPRARHLANIPAGDHRVYLLTLYAGATYRFQACGDDNVANVDLVLYDLDGAVLGRDATSDREPQLEYTPTGSTAVYLAVHASQLDDATKAGAIATAITYK